MLFRSEDQKGTQGEEEWHELGGKGREIKVGDEAAKTGSEIIYQEILAKLTSNMVQVLGTLFQRGPQNVVSSNC